MSYRAKAFGAFCPTGCEFWPAFLSQAYLPSSSGSSPHDHLVALPAQQAFPLRFGRANKSSGAAQDVTRSSETSQKRGSFSISLRRLQTARHRTRKSSPTGCRGEILLGAGSHHHPLILLLGHLVNPEVVRPGNRNPSSRASRLREHPCPDRANPSGTLPPGSAPGSSRSSW